MSDVPIPDQYRAIAELVGGYVDDRLGEFRQEIHDLLGGFIKAIDNDRATLTRLQGNVSGLMSAVEALQETAGESMPEHVYKQFIRSEAERLRLVKKVVRDDE